VSNRSALILVLLLVAGAILASRCIVVVAEYEQVVMTEFGDPVGGARTQPGVYGAMPWYEIRRFSKRMLRWDSDRAQIPTKDKRFIWVDATARWRVVDALKFYQSVHDFPGAQTRLDDVLDSALRQVISDNNLIEAVRPDTRPVDIPGMSTMTHDELAVRKGRDVLQTEIWSRSKVLIRNEFGIELVDVRLKRLNYIEAVQQNVLGRMIAERQKVAEQYRSEGKGRAAEIQGSMERKLREIRSEAYRKSREIAGQAEAEATRIYAEAYNADPEFYAFLQTMEAYPSLLGDGRGKGTHTGLVLGTDSELMGYLKSARPVWTR
jgi:membrane protease subunit HflC